MVVGLVSLVGFPWRFDRRLLSGVDEGCGIMAIRGVWSRVVVDLGFGYRWFFR